MDLHVEATGPETTPGLRPDPFRPSEYTGLLLEAVQQLPAPGPDSDAAEIGVGSGVVLASLGQRGFTRLHGVDSNPEALRATAALLDGLGLGGRARLAAGSVWQPFAGQRFDVVAANLPQFPSDLPTDADRSPSWGTGGADGRRVMDPFIAGLSAHLKPGGVALITHSTIVGTARTQAMLAAQGLRCAAVLAAQVLLRPDKADLLPASSWARGRALGLLQLGPYRFIEVHILRIAAA